MRTAWGTDARTGRQSKNVIDVRSPKAKQKYETKVQAGENHKQQIFNPEMTGKLTYLKNRMANADRLANKGAGAQAMKSPAKTSGATKFSTRSNKTEFLKHTVKRGK